MGYHYLIDGYNVLYAYKFRRTKRSDDWKDLVSHMHRLFGKKMGNTITIFFDGTAGRGEPERFVIGRVNVIFTVDEEADEVIRRTVIKRKEREKLLVISSDKQVREHARLHGVQTMGVGEVLKRLFPVSKPSPRTEKPGEEEAGRITDELRREFKIDE